MKQEPSYPPARNAQPRNQNRNDGAWTLSSVNMVFYEGELTERGWRETMKHEAFAWLQIQEARRGSGLGHGPGRVAASARTASGKPPGPDRPGAEPGTPGDREHGPLRGDRSCSSFSWSHFRDETGGPGWVVVPHASPRPVTCF